MDIISSNPYRVLGVFSNSLIKERIANANKLKAYLAVSKPVTFPIDLSHLIPTPVRTTESVEHANACINLPQNQLKYALFWFIKCTSIDDMALEYLQKGDVEKAKELFEKKETWSSLINRGVLALIQDDKTTAIQCITKVIHNEDYRAAFVVAVCDSTFQISEDDLAQMFIDDLLVEIPAQQLMQLFSDFGMSADDDGYLKKKVIDGPLKIINTEIAQAKTVKNNDADAQYKAGVALMNKAKEALCIIRNLLETDDMQYQIVADNLAKQILQCGINYYNNSDEPDAAIKAMPIQKYALQIAVGALVKDRCRENVNVLQQIIDDLPPKEIIEEDKKIKRELELYLNNGKSIMAAIYLLQNCQNLIRGIQSKLGLNSRYVLKITDLLLEEVLQETISEINEFQKEDPSKKRLFLYEYSSANEQQNFTKERNNWVNQLRYITKQAWHLLLLMESFPMSNEFREKRFIPNKLVLNGICKSLSIKTGTFSFLTNLSLTKWLIWLIFIVTGFLIYLSSQIG